LRVDLAGVFLMPTFPDAIRVMVKYSDARARMPTNNIAAERVNRNHAGDARRFIDDSETRLWLPKR
jgi:hypothetical protein